MSESEKTILPGTDDDCSTGHPVGTRPRNIYVSGEAEGSDAFQVYRVTEEDGGFYRSELIFRTDGRGRNLEREYASASEADVHDTGTEKYLGGEGVWRHTSTLIDRALSSLPLAILGVVALVLGTAALATTDNLAFMAAAGLMLVCGGVGLLPWLRTMMRLAKHTSRLKAETRRRGRGWARS